MVVLQQHQQWSTAPSLLTADQVAVLTLHLLDPPASINSSWDRPLVGQPPLGFKQFFLGSSSVLVGSPQDQRLSQGARTSSVNCASAGLCYRYIGNGARRPHSSSLTGSLRPVAIHWISNPSAPINSSWDRPLVGQPHLGFKQFFLGSSLSSWDRRISGSRVVRGRAASMAPAQGCAIATLATARGALTPLR